MFSSFIIYFSIILFTSLFAELSVRLKGKSLRSVAVFFTLLIPSFFAGIRYGIGTDYFAYARIFSILESGETYRTEFGFNFLNILVAKLGGNIQVLFFMVSFLTILFIYLNLYKNKDSLSVGLGMFVFMLLYYHSSFNIIRQVLAIAISLYSINFISEKKPLKFFLLTLLATSFHTSSILLAPFYYIYNLIGEKSRYFRISIYVVTVFLMFNYDVVLEFIGSTFTSTSYYLQYLTDVEYEFGLGIIAFNIPFIVPGIIFYRRLVAKEYKFKIYFFFFLIGFILEFLGYFASDHFDRISEPFYISLVMIVPIYNKYLRRDELEYVIGVLVVLFVIFIWFFDYIYNGYNQTIPFRSIFSK